MIVFVALILVVVVLLVGLVLVGVREDTGEDPLQRRLAEYGDRDVPASLEEIELSLSTRERVIVPMYKALARFAVTFTPENQIDSIRRQIELAGKSATMEPDLLWAAGCADAGDRLGAFVLFFFVTDWGLSGAVGRSLGPRWGISSGASAQSQIGGGGIRSSRHCLTLNLLTICVEAGLGFEQAQAKSTRSGTTIWRLRLGAFCRISRKRHGEPCAMSRRMDVPDVTSFVAALVQAEQPVKALPICASSPTRCASPPPACPGESSAGAGEDDDRWFC